MKDLNIFFPSKRPDDFLLEEADRQRANSMPAYPTMPIYPNPFLDEGYLPVVAFSLDSQSFYEKRNQDLQSSRSSVSETGSTSQDNDTPDNQSQERTSLSSSIIANQRISTSYGFSPSTGSYLSSNYFPQNEEDTENSSSDSDDDGKSQSEPSKTPPDEVGFLGEWSSSDSEDEENT